MFNQISIQYRSDILVFNLKSTVSRPVTTTYKSIEIMCKQTENE